MKLLELKKEIEQYQYFEDTNIIDVALASIVATRLQLGNPIWLIIIGPSSGGKSQILRPLALTDEKFLHRIDDLTENTFLSGMKLGAGKNAPSLLTRIGEKGILVLSDLTVLFSKNSEAKGTILSQFRMIYDGEMVKYSGTSDKPLRWKGSLGVLAGSTPSIYRHFEEVADMGERFIYWRMKDYSEEQALNTVMHRTTFDHTLDDKLATLYADYIKEVVVAMNGKEMVLDEKTKRIIIDISMFAELVRTTVHMDWDKTIDKIPVPAYPMRVALQLLAIAKGLLAMRQAEFGDSAILDNTDHSIIEWCGYSLANEEKRSCLKVLCAGAVEVALKTQTIADKVGLSTSVIGNIMQNLAAVGVVKRSGESGNLTWAMKKESDWKIVRRLENIDTQTLFKEREITQEEEKENDEMLNDIMKKFDAPKR